MNLTTEYLASLRKNAEAMRDNNLALVDMHGAVTLALLDALDDAMGPRVMVDGAPARAVEPGFVAADAEEARQGESTAHTQRRRAEFYAMENRQVGLTRGRFRPEEPNVRVYGRAVAAVLELARKALSPEDFRNLVLWVAEDLGFNVVKSTYVAKGDDGRRVAGGGPEVPVDTVLDGVRIETGGWRDSTSSIRCDGSEMTSDGPVRTHEPHPLSTPCPARHDLVKTYGEPPYHSIEKLKGTSTPGASPTAADLEARFDASLRSPIGTGKALLAEAQALLDKITKK